MTGFSIETIVRIDEEAVELQRILTEGLLFPVFQPILDFRVRAILGYESLIRGPEDSPLHRPDQLFATAARCGARSIWSTPAARPACVPLPPSAWPADCSQRHANLPARQPPDERPHPRLLSELGMAANRIVLELTENQRITDLPGIHEALLHYRGRGFQIAIDDLGEGFANLRMWSELRPEFVKIDKHFVHGIADDRIKFHFVRAMQDLAEICNARWSPRASNAARISSACETWASPAARAISSPGRSASRHVN
jgi:EAL domain-containing protein (putative c-di-GMP-specific phosphodiesterase class I)